HASVVYRRIATPLQLRDVPYGIPRAPPVFEPATVTALAESPFNDQRAAAFAHRNIIAVIGALVALADHVLDNCVPVQLLQLANLLLFFVGERLFVFAMHVVYPAPFARALSGESAAARVSSTVDCSLLRFAIQSLLCALIDSCPPMSKRSRRLVRARPAHHCSRELLCRSPFAFFHPGRLFVLPPACSAAPWLVLF